MLEGSHTGRSIGHPPMSQRGFGAYRSPANVFNQAASIGSHVKDPSGC